MPSRHRGGGGLHGTLVREAMSTPIVTCTPGTSLRDVAARMTGHGVHSVVVLQPDRPDAAPAHRRWGVLSDVDLVSAAPWDESDADAGSVAASPQAVVGPDETLAAAAHLMSEYRTAHLLVAEEGRDEPVGIISALDVATALARAKEPPRASARA